jgi:Fucose permease
MAAAGEKTGRPWSAVGVVYAAALLQGLTLIGVPALSNVLQQRFGLTDTDYGAVFLPQVAATVIGALMSGGLAGRVGLRPLLFVSLIANAACQVLLATPGLLLPEVAFTLILAATAALGLAFGLFAAPMNGYPPMLFPRHAPSAILAAHSVVGAGLALGPLVATGFVEAETWTGYPLLLAGVCGALALLVLGCRLPVHPALPAETAHGCAAVVQARRRARHSWTFWLFAVIAVTYAVAEGAFSNWVVIYLTEARQLSEAGASLALSLFWVAMVTGRLGVAVLVTRIPPATVWIVLPGLITAAFLIIPRADAPTASVAAFAFAGLACSGFYPLTIALASAAFPREVAWVSSMLIAALMIGVGAGTFAIGALRAFVTFDAIYRVSALLPLVLVVLALPLVRRPSAFNRAAVPAVVTAEPPHPERTR